MRPVIQVEHLSKAYRIGLKEEIPDTITGAITGWMKAPFRNLKRLRKLNTFSESGPRKAESGNGDSAITAASQPSTLNPQPSNDTLWALKDVSFEVNEGEVVGIIGRNGAGKSTLLKILSRITEPTSGRAVIRGRVGSLLEVGTGFHPELTGRENVYMNGTILGMRKQEIDSKFDEIVDFSGVELFLDTPIKRYSSGMQVRLAFAVAAHLDPEILIVDEVLAVGDAEFQKKCLGKMQDVASRGRTVLLVSHNQNAISSLATTALRFQSGCLCGLGDTKHQLHLYNVSSCPEQVPSLAARVDRGGDGRMRLQRIMLCDSHGHEIPTAASGRPLSLHFEYVFSSPAHVTNIYVWISDESGTRISCLANSLSGDQLQHAPRHGTLECAIPKLHLLPGRYFLECMLVGDSVTADHVIGAHSFTVDHGPFYRSGRLPDRNHGAVPMDHEWSVRR